MEKYLLVLHWSLWSYGCRKGTNLCFTMWEIQTKTCLEWKEKYLICFSWEFFFYAHCFLDLFDQNTPGVSQDRRMFTFIFHYLLKTHRFEENLLCGRKSSFSCWFMFYCKLIAIYSVWWSPYNICHVCVCVCVFFSMGWA